MSIEETAKKLEQHLDRVAELVLEARRNSGGEPWYEASPDSTPEYWIGVCRATARRLRAQYEAEVDALKRRLAYADGHPPTCEECGDHDGTRRADGRVSGRDCHVTGEVDAMHAQIESESPGRYQRRLDAALSGHPRPWEVE